MLIIEIHVETIEETNSSTRPKREEKYPEQVSKISQIAGDRLRKAIKNRDPGYLIQFCKNEK